MEEPADAPLLASFSRTFSSTKKPTILYIEPFCRLQGFSSPDGRKRFVKALLHPCPYMDKCPLCREEHMDVCDHLITSCSRIPDPRKRLQLKLRLYNFPTESLPLNKNNILVRAMDNSVWRRCLTEFLSEIDY